MEKYNVPKLAEVNIQEFAGEKINHNILRQNLLQQDYKKYMTKKTVNLLKALSGDNQEKFVQIRNDLIKGLLVIGGTVALVTAGMGGLTIGVGKLALALGSVALGGILIRPLDKLKNAIFGVARNAKGMRPPTGGSIPAPGGRKPNVS